MAKRAKPAFDPKVFLATVNHGRKITRYRKAAVVFRQTDPGRCRLLCPQGQDQDRGRLEQGKEAVIAILGPGEFFGEGCLIGQPLRLATAKAVVDSEIMRVAKAEMMRVLHAEPAFGELFTAHLLTRNSRVEADLVDQLFNSSEKRLARTLLLLANFGKDGGPQPITDEDQPGNAGGDHRHDPARASAPS